MFFAFRIPAAVIIAVSLVWPFSSTSAAPMPFPDMIYTWYRYRESVQELKEREAISGYPDGTYRPKGLINRAEFLKIVFKAQGGPSPVQGACFSDVPEDAWYAPFVCAASRRSIVNGYPDGSFRPERTINIAEALKIILRTKGEEIEDAKGERWYEPYTSELDRTDVLSRHSYLPWEELTRERAADIVARVLHHTEDRTIPRLSPGCGRSPGEMPLSVTVNSEERNFLLTIPKEYVSHDPSPLLIAFHGRTNSNAQVRSYMGFDRAAEEFFVAYPAAIKNSNGSYSWSNPGDTPNQIRDVLFFDALVEKIADQYCIDMNRIFVAGHSLGAWMANTIACIRGDVIRASGSVGGDSIITPCAGPAAAIIIHNPDDNLSSFRSAELARDLRIRENACSAESDAVLPYSLLCRKYQSCDAGNDVIFCPHELDIDPQGNYYPHNWPREATPTIVEFFRGFR